MQRGFVAAFILMFISGIVPSLTQLDVAGINTPSASAQTAGQESVAITDVSITGTEDENATMTLTSLTEAKLGSVQITANSGFGVDGAPVVSSLTISGVAYPLDWVHAAADRLTIEPDSEIDLQPGTEMVVEWSKGDGVLPPVESYRAAIEEAPRLDTEALPSGDEAPTNSGVAEGVDLRSRAAVSEPNPLDRAAVAQGTLFRVLRTTRSQYLIGDISLIRAKSREIP